MKKLLSVAIVLVLAVALVGCGESVQSVESKTSATVAQQDGIYAKSEPIPVFNYSLPRHMWIQFYKATTAKVVRTWSVGVSYNGTPETEVMETVGYPVPMGTQLTNPQKIADSTYEGGFAIVDQSEPNGLYTPANLSTVVFTLGDDGQIAPVYIESHVLCWPYPVKWDEGRKLFVRVKGSKATLSIDTTGAQK